MKKNKGRKMKHKIREEFQKDKEGWMKSQWKEKGKRKLRIEKDLRGTRKDG